MYEPVTNAPKLRRYAVNGFGGVNETESAADNELRSTKNIIGDYPSLRSAPSAQTLDIIGADVEKILYISEEDGTVLFTGTARDESGLRFYYENSPVLLYGSASYSLTAQSLCAMGSKIFIFPDKLYFDELIPENGLRDMTHAEIIANAVFHSSTDNDGVITNYISGGTFAGFERGDSVVIADCSEDANNVRRAGVDSFGSDIVSAVVEKIENGKMYLLCYSADGADAALVNVTSGCTVSADVPSMNHVCCHNNRLWGTAADGTTVYASKLGDPFNFNSFAGISTDSWWARVASEGDFTAIYPYQNHIYAFKCGCIHEIYGDKPSNFKMPYSVKCGTVDGNSICESEGLMYFTSADGVYLYNGGTPQKISQKLDVRPDKSKAAVFGKNIFMTLGGVLYVYDTERSCWYRQDEADITDIYASDKGVYFADGGAVRKWDSGAEQVRWCIQTKEYMRRTEKSGCVNVWLKLSLAENACAAVSISTDGAPFVRWGMVRGDQRVCRVPVRLRRCDTFAVKIEGVGSARLYGMEFENYSGGESIPRGVVV